MTAPQIIIASFVGITGSAFLVLWMSVIRPYLFKRKGYKNGFKWGYEIWSDWDEAYDLAKQSGDTGIKLICIANFLFFIMYIVAFVSVTIFWDEARSTERSALLLLVLLEDPQGAFALLLMIDAG